MAIDSTSLTIPAIVKVTPPQGRILEASPSSPDVPSMPMDQLILQSKPATLDLPGVVPGKRYTASGNSGGYYFNGSSIINSFDGKKLDATLSVSVFFFSAKLRLTLNEQEDGSFKYAVDRLSGSSKFPEHSGTTLTLVSKEPGLTVLEDQEGRRMKIEALKGGSMRITYGESVTNFGS